MSKLRDVVAYLCKNYPYEIELSNARVTKMVYLVDWKSAIRNNRQLTDVKWIFDRFGPFNYAVFNEIRDDPFFKITITTNLHGQEKTLIGVEENVQYPSLTEEDIDIIDFVIEKTSPLYWDDFIKLVYSTYPIMTSERLSLLPLPELAAEYRELLKETES